MDAYTYTAAVRHAHTNPHGHSDQYTATAYGDLDGDTLVSEVVYFHPDQTGGWCPTITGEAPPIDAATMSTQWDMVVRHPSTDFF